MVDINDSDILCLREYKESGEVIKRMVTKQHNYLIVVSNHKFTSCEILPKKNDFAKNSILEVLILLLTEV